MKNTKFLVIAFLFCGATWSQEVKKTRAEIDAKVSELLSKMTLEEKVGQMTQITVTVFEDAKRPGYFDAAKLKQGIQEYHIGSILNVPNPGAPTLQRWQETMTAITNEANKSRLKIPILYGIDAIHGASYTAGATLFPQQIGLAATFNTDLVQRGAEISAYETRASSIPWVFSPDLDFPRNPAWSRMWESFGEDAYLSSKMAVALVNGFERNNVGSKYSVASCMKHYIGYGSTTTGKDRTPSIIPERILRQYDLTIYEAAIKAGAKSVMVSSGEINGTPVHSSKHLITDILKNELGFEGVVVTDWKDIIYLNTRHKVVETKRDAVRIAVMAGIDMSMVPEEFTFYTDLVDLVKKGEVPMSRIDDAVSRILRMKFELNLFQNTVANLKEYPKFGSAEHIEEAYKTAAESITLLKNNNAVLPLNKNEKILVTGATANSMKNLNGGWSYNWQGENADTYAAEKLTILEAFQAKLGKENVLYTAGADIEKEDDAEIQKAVELAKSASKIVLCLGEKNYTETPGDISNIFMSKSQIKLALALAKVNKPIILVLNEGRPRLISDFEDKMSAVVQCYLPGNEGGRALVDILYGEVNPSGRLPYNYPKYPNSLEKYNRKYTESLADEEQNNDAKYEKSYSPQFEFGSGLSYTTFTYSNLKIDKTEINNTEEVNVSVEVTNTGKRAGKEAVLLYLSDNFASITPEVKALKRFEKISLEPNETKTVKFTLNQKDLQFVNEDLKWISEKGTFTIQISNLKKDFLLK
ncbi:glycoside hydrolase family 3 N-terminal domain-containing protein [Flavobacterium sp. Fl-318]|uniref:beta-glucosidase n=1 Tax=Flavobacterium cupriresistens TaxID=2893885 RepID=A0ABU4RDR7_9FLAO|nr:MULTISPECIES: glycoside hydrolase family 3 N-terminal domain-containing protein [unclassified Flavobacterium]MDX6190731.1 glycoside hydrolase family 3 N-terminal domain-containing protein [Flavobacterium sp. Fl-318]UFH44094.1 glycoside hydrolase family 3 C-terminal domain-containing protein [Flavobacterium sp. F-323]